MWKQRNSKTRESELRQRQTTWNVTQVIRLDLMKPVCFDNQTATHKYPVCMWHAHTVHKPPPPLLAHCLGPRTSDIRLDEHVINETPINYRQLQYLIPHTTFRHSFFFLFYPLSTSQVYHYYRLRAEQMDHVGEIIFIIVTPYVRELKMNSLCVTSLLEIGK